MLFEWANDPATRAASFDTAPIPWETHVAWLDRKLASSDCRVYILSLERERERPVGVVRFDGVLGEQADISVTVAPEARGRGLASRLLDASVKALLESTPVRRVRAYVKPGNEASRRAFERAGFVPAPSERDGALTFIRARGGG